MDKGRIHGIFIFGKKETAGLAFPPKKAFIHYLLQNPVIPSEILSSPSCQNSHPIQPIVFFPTFY
jgi:hypothetical protein